MKTNSKTNHTTNTSSASAANTQSDASLRFGTMRAITLEKKLVNMDQIFGTRKNAREMTDDAFGKVFRDAQPDVTVR